jgi:hypothetical protein
LKEASKEARKHQATIETAYQLHSLPSAITKRMLLLRSITNHKYSMIGK